MCNEKKISTGYSSDRASYWLDDEKPFPTPIFNGCVQYVDKLYPDEPRTPQTSLGPGQIAR